jgi:hypothetical protein
LTTTLKNIVIDQATYNSLVIGTFTYTLPTGSVTITIEKSAITYYNYELNLNESKRSIKILNSAYVDQLEKQFTDLMAA